MDKDFFCRMASVDDARFVARDVREGDREELLLTHASVEEALIDGVKRSEYAYAWGWGDKLTAVGGIAPGETPLAKVIWMVATKNVIHHPIDTMRYTKFFVEHFLERFVKLYNFVDHRNATSIRYLYCSGAHFLPEFNSIVNGQMMYYFEFAK